MFFEAGLGLMGERAQMQNNKKQLVLVGVYVCVWSWGSERGSRSRIHAAASCHIIANNLYVCACHGDNHMGLSHVLFTAVNGSRDWGPPTFTPPPLGDWVGVGWWWGGCPQDTWESGTMEQHVSRTELPFSLIKATPRSFLTLKYISVSLPGIFFIWKDYLSFTISHPYYHQKPPKVASDSNPHRLSRQMHITLSHINSEGQQCLYTRSQSESENHSRHN